jgi:hypothetical protein
MGAPEELDAPMLGCSPIVVYAVYSSRRMSSFSSKSWTGSPSGMCPG